jgi:hypothetical protein
METETFLMLAVRLKYITQAEASKAFALVTEVSKMLTSLRSRLKEDGDQRQQVPSPLLPVPCHQFPVTCSL